MNFYGERGFFGGGHESMGVPQVNMIDDRPILDPRSTEVRHSDVGPDFHVNYVEYDHLEEIPPSADLMNVFVKIKGGFESHDWKKVFESINLLRCLNKSHGKEINLIFEAFGMSIIALMKSIRTALIKNMMAFFNEVLEKGRANNLDVRVVVRLIELILSHANSQHKSIRLMAEQCLTRIVENFNSDETITEFCAQVSKKNKTVDNVGFNYLVHSIRLLNDKLSMVNNQTLRTIFTTMRLVMRSDSGGNKQLAKKIMQFICFLMGQENYHKYLGFLVQNNVFSIQDAEDLMAIVVHRKSSRVSLLPHIMNSRQSMGKSKHDPRIDLVLKNYH